MDPGQWPDSMNTSETTNLERLQRERGYSDALAEHGPAMCDGPYMVGYRKGRAEIGQPMAYMPPSWADKTTNRENCDGCKKWKEKFEQLERTMKRAAEHDH